MFNAWQFCNATNSHCRRRVWLVHITVWWSGNFALPPDDLTSSHCRPMVWPVHIADGIVDGGFDKFALPPEDVARSHCSPDGLTSSHCRLTIWHFRIATRKLDMSFSLDWWLGQFTSLLQSLTNSHCCMRFCEDHIFYFTYNFEIRVSFSNQTLNFHNRLKQFWISTFYFILKFKHDFIFSVSFSISFSRFHLRTTCPTFISNALLPFSF